MPQPNNLQHNRKKRLATTTTVKATTKSTAPASIDWRNVTGMVQPIKNQGSCGSCWAFSAVAALEGQYFKKYGKSLSLSEQNLVDCIYGASGGGCNGSFPQLAYEYLQWNGGIDTEAGYPVE